MHMLFNSPKYIAHEVPIVDVKHGIWNFDYQHFLCHRLAVTRQLKVVAETANSKSLATFSHDPDVTWGYTRVSRVEAFQWATW